MSSIKEIRTLTGLTQQRLAEWLGVSKSLLQFAEKGQRELPWEAYNRLNAMHVVASRQQPGNEAGAATTPNSSVSLAENHRRKMQSYLNAAKNLRAELKKLQTRQPKLDKCQEVFDGLKNTDLAFYKPSERDKKWMEFNQWFLEGGKRKSSAEQLEILQDRIDTCLAYAEVHRKMWEG